MHVKAFVHNVQDKQSYKFIRKYKISKIKKPNTPPSVSCSCLRNSSFLRKSSFSWECRNRIRKARAHFEFNLVRDAEGFKYIMFIMVFIIIFIALCHLVDSAFSINFNNCRTLNINRCYSSMIFFHVFLIHDWIMEDLMIMRRISCLVTPFKMEGIKQT